ncbi:MAG: argininosuccinate synthase, partial [Chloroflexi bacterium]|nr:argininosuccinate synthase [Chloroflexota bacterium]
VRFELTVMALDPRLKVIAPWREWDIRSREDAIAYAAAHNVPVTATIKSIYSRDSNLWHLSHEGGLLEDPWNEPEEPMFQMSTSPENAPDEPTYVEIDFESGTPVAVNGEKMSPAALIAYLNAVGGANGIGRVDLVENRLVGMKSHGVYETPGGTILLYAHNELESLVLDRETLHYKETIAIKYAEVVYNGLWFTPLREALDAFVNSTQGPVTGKVRLKLYKGNVITAGRTSPFSLYREDFATFGQENVYDQSDAEGFIRLYGLSLKVRALNGLPISGLDMPKPDYSRFKRD